MQEDVAPEDVAPEDVAPEDVAPEDVAPEDVAQRYRRLAAAMTEKIEHVPGDAWNNQSPCAEWTAV